VGVGDGEKIADAREMGTLFCWGICGIWMESSEVWGSFMYSSTIIWPCICGEAVTVKPLRVVSVTIVFLNVLFSLYSP
jgi:hypothetical protein